MNSHVQIKLAKAQIGNVLEALSHFLSDDDEALKLDMLEGETSLNEIVSALLAANEDDEGTMAALDEQIDSRASRKQRIAHRIEGRRTAIGSLMDCARVTKLPLPEATVSLRTIQPRPKVADEASLPADFIKVVEVRKVDMEAIKEAVERGETIPGVVMTNGGSSLTVRRK